MRTKRRHFCLLAAVMSFVLSSCDGGKEGADLKAEIQQLRDKNEALEKQKTLDQVAAERQRQQAKFDALQEQIAALGKNVTQAIANERAARQRWADEMKSQSEALNKRLDQLAEALKSRMQSDDEGKKLVAQLIEEIKKEMGKQQQQQTAAPSSLEAKKKGDDDTEKLIKQVAIIALEAVCAYYPATCPFVQILVGILSSPDTSEGTLSAGSAGVQELLKKAKEAAGNIKDDEGLKRLKKALETAESILDQPGIQAPNLKAFLESARTALNEAGPSAIK